MGGLNIEKRTAYCRRKENLLWQTAQDWTVFDKQIFLVQLCKADIKTGSVTGHPRDLFIIFFLTNTGSDTCTIKVIIFWKKNPVYSDQINQWCREYKAGRGKWQGPAVWGQNLECQNYIYHRAEFLIFFLSWIVLYISVSYTSASSWFLLWLFLL